MDEAFDLNVERVLEHWTPAHALREVIANALDEHALTGRTDRPSITKDADGVWHVRDKGRGLRYQHLTQNESEEKRGSDIVVGQFGVGLKDALATFHRNGVDVRIASPHGTIGLVEQSKHGFGDVVTLHATVGPPAAVDGTDVALAGISDVDVVEAMGYFLVYDESIEILETTASGQVLARPGRAAAGSVYVRGVRVAEDDGLLLSYNVTKVDAKLRRALNRERANVGRSAYTDRIKAILLAVDEPVVLTRLVDDMAGFARGSTHDEVTWTDIAERVVCKLAATDPDTVFVTAGQRWSHPELVRRAEQDGKHVFVIPDALAARLRNADDAVTTLERFAGDWNERVVIEPIDPALLDDDERAVLAVADDVVKVVGRGAEGWSVVVSETLHLTPDGTETALGLWEPTLRRIVINRRCLASTELFVGTLLHEIGHAITGATDLTAAFEDGLTELLGTVGAHAVAT